MEEYKSCQLKIDGMDCADCAVKLEQNIGKLPGVKLVRVDFMNSKLKVKFDETTTGIEQITSEIDKAGYRVVSGDKPRQSVLIVKDMDCADESRPIEERLRKMEGIDSIKFNLVANKLIVEHRIPLQEIQQALHSLGFESELEQDRRTVTKQSFFEQQKLLFLTIVAGIFAISGLILQHLGSGGKLVIPFYTIAIISGGIHIFKKGIVEARNLRLGMNFLMSIAVIGAVFINEWSEAAMVVFLFSLAQLLESYSIDRARKSIQSLLELAPNIATIKTPEGDKSVPVEEIGVGDTIIIKPGERIPLDGVVVQGSSAVNQAPITGESIPVAKMAGDDVFAGTINEKGVLEVRVTKKSADSTLAHIINLVEEAQAQKAPSQSFVEKFARYYTPAVVSFAILLAVLPPLLGAGAFHQWFYRALVMLVISCPCALVISTPVTIVSGLTNAARHGILIKGGAYLENFNSLKVIAFDKTGTLTIGKPRVQRIIPLNHHSEQELLSIAASIEARSEHPLAQAIVDYAEQKNISPKEIVNFQSITGKGARASIDGTVYLIGNHRLFEEQGWCDQSNHPYLEAIENHNHTAVMVGNEQNVLGIIAIADAVRKNARQAIRELHRTGIEKIVMLTGDNQQTAAAIAAKIGVDEFKAELLPQDKVELVKQLLRQYQNVAMVGDGINDAPALATATMGISMGTAGTDTALETADIALMKDDLSKLPFLKVLSKRTVQIIKQNIFFALFLKAIFVVLAIPGWATLWLAVFADMGASLMVVFNGLRVLKVNHNNN